jgi:hypothetical protein
MSVLSSKFFWINLIAVLINLGQYLFGMHFWPQYDLLITVIIGSLQVISNSIAGMTMTVRVKALKALCHAYESEK